MIIFILIVLAVLAVAVGWYATVGLRHEYQRLIQRHTNYPEG